MSTSSKIIRAPCSRVISRRPSLNPGPGVTTPMLQGAASVITAAIFPGCSSKAFRTASRSLYGSTMVSAAVAAVTPAEPGIARVATPEPASDSSASTCPW
ncbi:Uncharacterised protein [Mycobacteroides abscessus subsp. abscessus]|nr:Uncharacterised protein [Mycobacteroides abscessus subsp. abscessus]